MAARELGTVSLADALALTLLTAELEDDRWPRAAARWLGRFTSSRQQSRLAKSAWPPQPWENSMVPIDG